MPHLYIIRGLPGSGKSTLARKLVNWDVRHVEADMFFETSNNYKFDSKLLSVAHEWCYSTVVKHLYYGYDVVVSNTFTMMWEIEKYLAISTMIENMTYSIIEMKSQYGSIHGVPEETLERMKSRWKTIDPRSEIGMMLIDSDLFEDQLQTNWVEK